MRKLSVTLIAVIVTALFLAITATAQFSIPKIKIPKVPKTDTSSQPSSSDSPSSPASNSSSPTSSGDVRGIPIRGARITFSNNPDGSNPKTSFSSSEYIYGHLDLGGRTMAEAFGLNKMANASFYYINYDIQIWKPGEKPWDNWSGHNYTLVTKEDAQKTYWNFDVLPDPTNVSTRGSAVSDELEYYKFVSGIYGKWYDADSARSTFPQSGTYTIDITLFGNSYDDWGKSTGKIEEFPTASAQFAFQFSGADGQTLVANSKKAKDNMEAAKNRREMLHAMPDFWARGANPAAEPKLAPARLVPMIKNYIGQWNLTYMKHMIYPFNGPIWAVEKNDLGIPRYRRVTSAIYIIYRDPKDNSCQLGTLDMREPYAGGGTYSEAILNGIGDIQYIDCYVVK